MSRDRFARHQEVVRQMRLRLSDRKRDRKIKKPHWTETVEDVLMSGRVDTALKEAYKRLVKYEQPGPEERTTTRDNS